MSRVRNFSSRGSTLTFYSSIVKKCHSYSIDPLGSKILSATSSKFYANDMYAAVCYSNFIESGSIKIGDSYCLNGFSKSEKST